MDYDSPPENSSTEELQHLKRVSRVKHVILERYLPPWAIILSSGSAQLAYVDCFAGPGQYEMQGRVVEGSPIIAVAKAKNLVQSNKVRSLLVLLIDDQPGQIASLTERLRNLEPYPPNLSVTIKCADSQSVVSNALDSLRPHVPAFFLIDPYGHPLPLGLVNRILRRQKTEALINLMWYQINRDLNNPKVESRLDSLFGDHDWHSQPFMGMHGIERERAFLSYFVSRLEAKYVLSFRIRYDPEDSRGGHRTKYYLLHASSHEKATLLMKEVMWPLGDEEGTFDYSGESQGVLISSTPKAEELSMILLRLLRGREIGFDQLRKMTWDLPFIEKHYREVLKALEGTNEVAIRRITSKRSGISGNDRIAFK